MSVCPDRMAAISRFSLYLKKQNNILKYMCTRETCLFSMRCGGVGRTIAKCFKHINLVRSVYMSYYNYLYTAISVKYAYYYHSFMFTLRDSVAKELFHKQYCIDGFALIFPFLVNLSKLNIPNVYHKHLTIAHLSQALTLAILKSLLVFTLSFVIFRVVACLLQVITCLQF